MSSDDIVEDQDPRKALIQANKDRIEAIELRGDEIRKSLDRKDLNEVVSAALVEEYHDLWAEYWDLKAEEGYLQI